MKLYQKLFFATLNRTQLLVAGGATFVGFLLLLIGANYVMQMQNFRSKNELLTDNVYVVQRKITSGGALNLQKTNFSQADMDYIKSQKFIENLQPVTTNNFDIDFQLSDKNMPYMRTDIFIQSILPEFLDIKGIDWHWDSTKAFVPIIIPKEFIVMMNSFLSSKGMPQISDELVKKIHFKFNLKDDGRKESVECRVVGYTSMFSAVLVPDEFMQYASRKYGKEKQKVTQLILSHKKDGFGDFKQFLKDNYLETKTTDLIMGQIKSMTLVLSNFVVALSFLIILLSGVIFSQYAQLLIDSKRFEIQTMIRLGHRSKEISTVIFKYFVRIILLVDAVVVVAFFGAIFPLNAYFFGYGFDFEKLFSIYPFVFLLLINLLLLYSIRRKIGAVVRLYE